MSKGFVAQAARGDENRIAADDGLLWRFSGTCAEAALPKNGLGVLEITLNEELHLLGRGGEVDDRHLAAEAVEGVIAGGNDTSSGVEDEVPLGVLLKTGQDFVENSDFCGEILRLALGIYGAVRPTHPGCNTVDAGVAPRPENGGQARFNLIIAADGGTAERRKIFCPMGFAGTGHTDESET